MVPGVLRHIFKVLLLVVIFGGIPGLLHADPFSLTANWKYSENGGEALVNSSRFNQNYSLSVVKSLSSLSDLTAALRYTKTERSDDSDSEILSPSATLSVRNDLFALNLGATQTQRKTVGDPELTNRTWDATCFSQLEDFPLLRINFGQSFNFDDQNPREQDRKLLYYSASIEHSWPVLELFYDYRHDENTDNVVTSKTLSDRHFAKIEYSDDYVQGKVGVNISQQYSDSRTQSTIQVGTGGEVFIPISVSQTLSAQDDTPLSGPLFPNAALNDGDRITATTVEIAQATIAQNLGMQTDFQSVNQFRVYLDRDVSLAIQGLLTWSLYSSVDNLNWDLISLAIPVSYEQENGLPVVVVDAPTLPLIDRYIKLVVHSTGLSPEPVFVTELVAGNLRIATNDQVVTSAKFVDYQTRANLTYALNPSWALAYNLTWIKREPENGLDNSQLVQGVNASYMPNPGFSASASITEHSDQIKSLEERRNRTYSLSAQKQLWRTSNVSMAYTHAESYEGATQQSEVDTVSGFFNAQLFPDLSASLNLAWSQSYNPQTGSSYEVYGWRLNSIAQLTRRISANAFYDYTFSEGGAADVNIEDYISNRYGVNCNIRTSDILFFYLSLNRDKQEELTTFRGSVSWQVTPKIQTNFSTSQDLEEGALKSYSTTVSWLISSHLTLRSAAAYRMGDGEDVWAWNLNMNATF